MLIYGISQNPKTKGNEVILDNFIKEIQLKINNYKDKFEWIQYNQFDDIKEIGKDTKEYIMVLQYAEGRNADYWLKSNTKYFSWLIKLKVLSNISNGLREIHQKQMLIEVLRGKPYTQAADIYSFGMIMYFVATGRQPFADRAHDEILVLYICEGVRPEINEPKAPKCYIDLIKRCLDSNPINRSNAAEIEELIRLFYNSYCPSEIKQDDNEIKKQFKEAEKYRSINQNNKSTIHPQAIYTSRLLNPFTKDLPEYINDKSQCLEYINDKTDCLDCAILQ
ncbi:kinase-like domain-containing protein [Glomus cerebriforme]|uniref:Kinase-like domain-containing protein n=1 Tax=Glomus cerebriforme TaxID=658196 RepID=A0A397SXH0_9GLOM|nr:kinase-like domain-containing protein [Glomus cerebriforme]